MPGIRDLNNKRVLVTGAGSGIGRVTAIAFAREGAHVIVSDIDSDRAQSVADEIGSRAEPHTMDVAQREAVEDLANDLVASGGVDVVFNNAGIAVGGPATDASFEDWDRLIGINLWGVVHGVRAFLPHMVERGSGHIVSTASMAGLFPCPGIAGYCATKHAVVGLGLSLRAEARRHGVGVSTICPGVINTNIAQDGVTYGEVAARKEQGVELLERWGRSPEAVARAVVKAVKRDKAIVPVGFEAWMAWYLMRFSPPLAEWLVLRPLGRRLT